MSTHFLFKLRIFEIKITFFLNENYARIALKCLVTALGLGYCELLIFAG